MQSNPSMKAAYGGQKESRNLMRGDSVVTFNQIGRDPDANNAQTGSRLGYDHGNSSYIYNDLSINSENY